MCRLSRSSRTLVGTYKMFVKPSPSWGRGGEVWVGYDYPGYMSVCASVNKIFKNGIPINFSFGGNCPSDTRNM